MMSLCPHGLAESDCLICRTLARTSSAPVGTAAVGTASPRRRRHRAGPGDVTDPVQRPDKVYPPGAAPRRARSLRFHIGLVSAAVVIIGLAVWVVAGLVLSVLHVIELSLVAAVAGWAGYRIGKYRGSRLRR